MKSVDLKTYDNSQFKPGNILKRGLWYCFNAAFINCMIPYPSGFKCWILRRFGARIGKRVLIKPRVSIKYPWFLDIGSDVWIGEGVWIDNLDTVRIASDVCISQGAMLLCGNHDYTKVSFDLVTRPIVLEEGVWVGAKAVICPGVTCHSHSILGVGGIANKDLEPYGIYLGNPAKMIRSREID